MNRASSWMGFVFSVLLVLILALPAIQWAVPFAPRGHLDGYTDDIPGRPAPLVKAFFDKTLQQWAKQYFDVHLGFRAFLVRTFNEIDFRIFRETTRMRLVTTKERGLYSNLSLNNINDEITHREDLEKKYQAEAQKLLRVQQMLKARGKYFEVVIGTSKTYVYPDGLGSRYLAGGSANIFERATSFGNVLKSAGVNVIDGGPELRKFAKDSGLDTHPDSGLHWNFYAGCLMARQILDNARERQLPATPRLDCGTPQLSIRGDMTDVDGLRLLNIWSDGGLLRPSPFPTIVPVKETAWRPKIVFIGDSFSDQITYALREANIFSRMVWSSYFVRREIDDRAGNKKIIAESAQTAEAAVRAELAADIEASDVIILEMVDYNVPRLGYGFADYMLGKVKQ